MRSDNVFIDYRLKVKRNKTDGVQNYDYDNLYPQRVREIVRASGTASNCVNTYAKFLRGSGFRDKNFYKSKINSKGLTPDKLLRKITQDFSLWHGFAILVKYNFLLKVQEVFHIPWEYCRKPEEEDAKGIGKIIVYDNWDKQKNKSIDKEKYSYIDIHSEDPLIIKRQSEVEGWDLWKGQVLWVSADGNDYPLAIYDSVIEDIRTDSGIKIYRLRLTTTNFMGSHVVELPYEFATEEEREAFLTNLKGFQGAENASKMLVLENKEASDTPIQITKIDIQDGDKMFETTNRTCKDSILEAFSMPPILVGVQVAGKLGSSTDLKDAYDYYNLVTSDERIMFEEIFTLLFNKFFTPINPTFDYSILPLNYSTGEVPSLIDSLGIGVTQALTAVLEGSLSTSQKIKILVKVFGLSEQDALEMSTPM